MSDYVDIVANELQTLLAAQEVLLIDVRRDEEVARGLIPGASHIPLHLIPLRLDELESGDCPLVFYCHSGMRSAQASALVSGRGRRNIYNLRGGILAWGQAGLPVAPKT